ncbi:MAG TPA: hypothetical protein VF756_03410 [Thermoanaerobaculia bacterium]
MPKGNAFSDFIDDLLGLREAVQRNPDVQPSIQEELATLDQSLTEVQTERARQEELTAQRQESTQKLKAAVARGKDAAIRVRSVVRGKIGPRSERLVHFDVSPLRKRTRTAGKAKKGSGETAGTGAGAAASPSDKPVV